MHRIGGTRLRGVNATQALGFGVPVIYADKELHAPEVEQLTPANSVIFSANDSSDLARAMVDAGLGRGWHFDEEAILAEIRGRTQSSEWLPPSCSWRSSVDRFNPTARPGRTTVGASRAAFDQIGASDPAEARVAWQGDLGEDFATGRRVAILSPQYFQAGDRVHIGQDFLCEVNAEIGDDVLISSFVRMIGDDHCFDVENTSVFASGRLPAQRQVLEGDNLIGNGVIILGNVTVGRGAIVGAGSLVTRDLPRNWVCVGKRLRSLSGHASRRETEPVVEAIDRYSRVYVAGHQASRDPRSGGPWPARALRILSAPVRLRSTFATETTTSTT